MTNAASVKLRCELILEISKGEDVLSWIVIGGGTGVLQTALSILLTCSPLGNANVSVLQHKHSNPPGSGTPN